METACSSETLVCKPARYNNPQYQHTSINPRSRDNLKSYPFLWKNAVYGVSKIYT
jgi:hypothetical protein